MKANECVRPKFNNVSKVHDNVPMKINDLAKEETMKKACKHLSIDIGAKKAHRAKWNLIRNIRRVENYFAKDFSQHDFAVRSIEWNRGRNILEATIWIIEGHQVVISFGLDSDGCVYSRTASYSRGEIPVSAGKRADKKYRYILGMPR